MMLSNMGPKWFYHRLLHSIKLKTKYFNYIEYKYSDIDKYLNLEITKRNLKDFKLKNSINLNELSKVDTSKKEEILKQANRVLNNEFEYFFNDTFKFGEINWHYNPYIDKEIPPNKKWYEIPMHDVNNGDIKDYWELNRFVFVYDLINAYSLTNDKMYVNKFIELVSDWIENNPFEYGVNYKCSQETSFRCLNWIMGILHLDLLEKHPKTTDYILTNILKQSYHVKSLMSYSVNCVKNNHTLNEAMFLYVIGSYFSFKDKNNFFLEGKTVYNESIEKQILSDGSYTQNSHTYHRVMLLSAILFKYFEKNDGDLTISSVVSITKASEFLKYFIMKNGDVPNYGSNDGSIPFNLVSSPYRDFRTSIDLVYKVFWNKQYYYSNENHINAWFSNGNFCMPQFNSKKEKEFKKSKFFESGGYLIFKNNNKKLFMRVNDGKYRPGQVDNNSIDLWCNDKNIILDTGSYKYTTDKEVTDYFKGSTGHNYLRINEQEPMKRISKFMYANWSKSEINKLDLDENFIEIINHDYRNFEVTRSVELKDGLYVRDYIKSSNSNSFKVEIFYHLNNNPELTFLSDNNIIFKLDIEKSIEFSSNGIIEYKLNYGSEAPFRGWKSTHYNKIEKTPQLVIEIYGEKEIILDSKILF